MQAEAVRIGAQRSRVFLVPGGNCAQAQHLLTGTRETTSSSKYAALCAAHRTMGKTRSTCNRNINAILQMPDVKEKLEGASKVLVGGGPEVLAQMVKLDLDSYESVVRKGQITAE